MSHFPGYLGGMKPTEFFRWWITDEGTGKRRKTTYLMCREDALMRDPGALAELPAVEVRTFPMSPAEHQFNSAWLRKE